MKHILAHSLAAVVLAPVAALATNAVSDIVIEEQRAALHEATEGQGFGPQSPRDIDTLAGDNSRSFATAPAYSEMNLCNIHFHEGAEHRGGQFTKFAGNGDGKGYGTGYLYAGELTEAELAPAGPVGEGHGGLEPGDTIEVHYVFSSAQITPGPTLGACLSESIMNPQLRVEAQVFVIVNDAEAADFAELMEVAVIDGYYQPVNLRNDTGEPVQYPGSTTGPSYNEKGSPLQVSWSVRPEVIKTDITSLGAWLEDNAFDEKGAHGVRNLVLNPALLSAVE